MYTINIFPLKTFLEGKSLKDSLKIIMNFDDLLVFKKDFDNPLKRELCLGDWGTKGMFIDYNTMKVYKNSKKVNESELIYQLHLMYDYTFIFGDSIHFGYPISERSYVERIIDCPYWSGSCSRFGSFLKDKKIILKIIESPYWNGDCEAFPRSFMNSESSVMKIIKSKRWNGTCIHFAPEVLSNIAVVRYIILECDAWDGEAHFPRSLMMEEIIIESIINSGKWDYDTTMIPNYSIKNVEIARMIVSSPKWDKNISIFHDSVFKDDSFMEDLIVNTPTEKLKTYKKTDVFKNESDEDNFVECKKDNLVDAVVQQIFNVINNNH